MSDQKVLLTGSTGYLGWRLARKYLAETDERLLLWIHAKSAEEFEPKQRKLADALGSDVSRVSFAFGDLGDAEPFKSVNPKEVSKIIHSAAVTRFNVDEKTAQTVNTEGAEKLMRFARSVPRLERFSLLSTVYASGLTEGAVNEEPLEASLPFANHYESSKNRSEQILMGEYRDLPWKILRVATVLADDEDGKVIQQNAVHNTLKLFYYGLISLIPGKPATPLYFVTGDFAAEALWQATESMPDRKIYHICHTRGESVTLGEMIDEAFQIYSNDPVFKGRRLLKPLFTDADSFDTLVSSVNAFGGSVLSQAVTSIAPFGRQLFIQKDIQNQELSSRMSGYRAPDAKKLVRKTCEYLVRTKFGKG